MPAQGTMVHLSPAYNPPVLKGIKINPHNPLRFEFILDTGDSHLRGNDKELKQESSKLIRYFLTSLTVPEKDLWVNLSPYEKERIVPEALGQTEMGRDLLAQDYMLKQITASLIYPEDEIGRKFWKRVYEEAAKKFVRTNIPVNTFNKVWIIPEKAIVYENAKAGTAYVVEATLKVMLEQDYVAQSKNFATTSAARNLKNSSASPQDDVNHLGSQIIREVIIPQLTKEVNEGRNFVQLRQVYHSLVLAAWYKRKMRDGILSQVYADKNKVSGISIENFDEKQKIYEQYLQAFKKGAYNYIKEEIDPVTQESVTRKYFSGGVGFALNISRVMRVGDNAQVVSERVNNNTMKVAMDLNRLPARQDAAMTGDVSEGRDDIEFYEGLGDFTADEAWTAIKRINKAIDKRTRFYHIRGDAIRQTLDGGDTRKFFLAVDKPTHAIVGYVFFDEETQGENYIYYLAADPDYKKALVGFVLIRKVFEYSHENNIRRVNLLVHAEEPNADFNDKDYRDPRKVGPYVHNKAIGFYDNLPFHIPGLHLDRTPSRLVADEELEAQTGGWVYYSFSYNPERSPSTGPEVAAADADKAMVGMTLTEALNKGLPEPEMRPKTVLVFPEGRQFSKERIIEAINALEPVLADEHLAPYMYADQQGDRARVMLNLIEIKKEIDVEVIKALTALAKDKRSAPFVPDHHEDLGFEHLVWAQKDFDENRKAAQQFRLKLMALKRMLQAPHTTPFFLPDAHVLIVPPDHAKSYIKTYQDDQWKSLKIIPTLAVVGDRIYSAGDIVRAVGRLEDVTPVFNAGVLEVELSTMDELSRDLMLDMARQFGKELRMTERSIQLRFSPVDEEHDVIQGYKNWLATLKGEVLRAVTGHRFVSNANILLIDGWLEMGVERKDQWQFSSVLDDLIYRVGRLKSIGIGSVDHAVRHLELFSRYRDHYEFLINAINREHPGWISIAARGNALPHGGVVIPDNHVEDVKRLLSRLNIVLKLKSFDAAMITDKVERPGYTGGIDLTSDHALTLQNNGRAIKFHIDPALYSELADAPGFTPEIINMEPMPNLRVWLGLGLGYAI